MVAKIILYPDGSAQETNLEILRAEPQIGLRHWQLVAGNLTTGEMVELLVCLDGLGFLSLESNPAPSD